MLNIKSDIENEPIPSIYERIKIDMKEIEIVIKRMNAGESFNDLTIELNLDRSPTLYWINEYKRGRRW